MNKYKVLILTDHEKHSKENSLYELATGLLVNSRVEHVDIASRAVESNNDFFNYLIPKDLFATRITESFNFDYDHHPLDIDYTKVQLLEYDFIWLRLPPPLSLEFLEFLHATFSKQIVINNPKSIYIAGAKDFLLNFSELCPPMKLCRSVEDILSFKEKFSIVLKPLREYGGKGIVKIENDIVFEGQVQKSLDQFIESYNANPIDYLGVQYMKNVHKGDKRIVVVNGTIIGSSLRIPKKGSWLCNASMGGSSHMAEISPEEYDIVERINPVLVEMGIVMYGIDTLMGNDNKRILSEINVSSIGGIKQMANQTGKPLIQKTINELLKYVDYLS